MASVVRRNDATASSAGNRNIAIAATDGELLMRFSRHRDQRAFAEIVERHGRLVWMVCYQVLRHQQDVEDAFQASFLILAQRARSIRASGSAAAWLYKVAQRTALAARRKRSRRREETLAAEPPLGEEAIPIIRDEQLLSFLMEELRGLPERYQIPLVQRYVEGQSRRTIAELTDSTVAQVQGRLMRGRRMLRTRLARRGVSLSLASGAMNGLSAKANAAMSSDRVVATAENCLKFRTSGAAGGVSPVALALAQAGVKSMWFASIVKPAAVVATLVAVGVVWAAQQGGGSSANDGGSTPVSVALQTADRNDNPDELTATAIAAADGREQGNAFLAGKLKYRIPVEIGFTETKEGAHIEIEEVWGTRPRIEVGGQYMVRGKYVLPPGRRGTLYFYETATGDWGREPTADVDLQRVTFDKPTGEFTLLHGMIGPGNFHLYLADPDKYSHVFANVYFGTGENVWRKKEAAAAASVPPRAAQATAVQPTSEIPLAAVEPQRQHLKDMIQEATDILEAMLDSKVEATAEYKMREIETAALQKQHERLTDKLAETDLALDSPANESTKEIRQKQLNERDYVAKNLENVAHELRRHMQDTQKKTVELEKIQLELSARQRQLETMQNVRDRLDLPQGLVPTTRNPSPAPSSTATDPDQPMPSRGDAKQLPRISGSDAQSSPVAMADPVDENNRLSKAITDLQKQLERKIDDKAEEAADLEILQFAKGLLQREVEQVHATLSQLKLPQISSSGKEPSADETARQDKAQQELEKKLEALTDELESLTKRTAKKSSEMGQLELELAQLQRRLDELSRLDGQSQFAPRVPTPELPSIDRPTQ